MFDTPIDDFVPMLDDVDEVLFTNKSLVLPIVDCNMESLTSRYSTVTAAKLENVKRDSMKLLNVGLRGALMIGKCFVAFLLKNRSKSYLRKTIYSHLWICSPSLY